MNFGRSKVVFWFFGDFREFVVVFRFSNLEIFGFCTEGFLFLWEIEGIVDYSLLKLRDLCFSGRFCFISVGCVF